ncbi:hypothetical protein FYK55_22365 [Roseiconus nitratireducens]|uniref:Uncharacterized protein n=1 Tax=Roseiconus nitratireducens TaxID=2605748 RepID=A0A5M6D2Z3_9BACT|nr:hypothetical protein [Roseiconus nitratireducens]KAA5540059.1 hypothetical protein FYK55_22365 [Roseiconus nitratireducens]
MDSDKIKDFIVYNFEKLIVAIVILLSAYLVYEGMNKEDITAQHDPDRLAADATEVRRQVDEDHNENIIPDRVPQFDIARKLDDFSQAVDPKSYALDPWDPALSEASQVRREDPTLSPPAGIQTFGVIASLAYRSRDGEYPLSELEPAEPVEKVEQEVKPRSRRRGRGGDAMEMEMMMMMEGMGDEGMGYGDMEMMMGGTPTGSTESSGPVRKLNSTERRGVTPKQTKDFINGADQEPVPGFGYFITGSAAIPHKDIIKAYQEALSNAADYDPMRRDFPNYLDYEVQRADVTNKTVDELQDSDWVTRDNRRTTTLNAARYWSGFAPELVPADYRVDGLTMWIPPVLLDDYSDFSLNPLIPMKSQRELEMEQAQREVEQKRQGPAIFDEEKVEIDMTGRASRSYGMGMEMEMMDSMGMESGMEMDMMMMGGTGNAMAGKAAEENPVDYKLLRFYDFFYLRGAQRDPDAPKRGHQYVYRIRFCVDDPNFPKNPELQPKGSVLAPEAYQRVSELSAQAAQNNVRDFKRWSPWSEISEPTSLPPLDRAVVGPVKADKVRRVTENNRTVVVEGESPTAEIIASSFDPRLGVFIPVIVEASEGTVLGREAEKADVVDPITLEVKKVENPKIDSSATVIDIEGGVPLQIIEDEQMQEPGLFLMTDSNGKLIVRESVQDQQRYRRQSFAEDRGL